MEEITKSDVLQTIGKNIKRIRLLRGFSQQNLADDLDKSVNLISLLENGKTGPSVETIIDICKILNVDANAIFEGVIAPTDIKDNAFIIDSLNLFDKTDKDMVTNLINYIINSKS